MPTAAVLGLDTAAGAYLARLLRARGYAVRGTGGAALLDALGIVGEIAVLPTSAAAAIGASEIYDVRCDGAATAALLDGAVDARLFVAVAPDDTTSIAALGAARAAGLFVATGRVFAHESRLGPGTSPVARIVAATAAGDAPDAADLATATDCGWTAEYVDAMWRMLQRPGAGDLAIATGRLLAGSDVARVAARWFGRPTPPAAGASGLAGDPRPALDVLGWRATTIGDDLVEVLCEGIGGRRASRCA